MVAVPSVILPALTVVAVRRPVQTAPPPSYGHVSNELHHWYPVEQWRPLSPPIRILTARDGCRAVRDRAAVDSGGSHSSGRDGAW